MYQLCCCKISAQGYSPCSKGHCANDMPKVFGCDWHTVTSNVTF